MNSPLKQESSNLQYVICTVLHKISGKYKSGQTQIADIGPIKYTQKDHVTVWNDSVFFCSHCLSHSLGLELLIKLILLWQCEHLDWLTLSRVVPKVMLICARAAPVSAHTQTASLFTVFVIGPEILKEYLKPVLWFLWTCFLPLRWLMFLFAFQSNTVWGWW